MAPSKGPPKGAKGKPKSGPKGASKISKSAPSSKAKKSTPIKSTQQKTKPVPLKPAKKKKRVYTDKELNIPALNSIRPAGISKPHGTKKGKIFVDDGEGTMAILAMVQADKEGDIESKIMRARQLEEVREAKRAEAEKRLAGKRAKLDEVKGEVKRGEREKRRKRVEAVKKVAEKPVGKKKKVSFG